MNNMTPSRRSSRTVCRIIARAKLLTAAAWIILSFFAIIYTWAQQPSIIVSAQESAIQAAQDVHIVDIQKQVEAHEVKINQLEHDVWLWKGVVMALGSIISLLELLQALGLIRTGLSSRADVESTKRRGSHGHSE